MGSEERLAINEWRWPGVYPDRAGLSFGRDEAGFVVRDDSGPSAFCVFGHLDGFDPESYVAVSVGLRPDLVGGGNGRAFMRAVLELGRREFPGRTVIAVVKRSNVRSMTSALGAGFVQLQDADDDGEGVVVIDQQGLPSPPSSI